MKKPNNFQRVRELNYMQKAVLAAALLERMLPNYALFSDATEFGDTKIFRNALNSIWEKLVFPKSKINLELLVDKIEPNVPEIEDFDMFGVYPAIDTGTALLSMLNGMMIEDELEFVNISKISQASVAKLIEYQLGSDNLSANNEAIREHPLMKYEIEVLSELIDYVESMGRISSDTIKGLKAKSIADGQTNIGIEI
ncbi:YjaG family protein [Pseudoalteromonas sp. C2R02]|uniref:YjaG family protein n=1 Tax=Pseudoalteromonas sp. C2R02 TaxID=2841565 RepID=UPI001C097F75|nr:YjaG family protein [Pseudoalteromonas sp. C2R02]MBU2969464.1 YjaG family protein [Pseudoalteromonas sp. C2R02]